MLPSILGRSDATSVVDRALVDARTRAVTVCVRGEAGIGKTLLLDSARQVAAARGFTVLTCRPTSGETQMSFAALGDVLEPALNWVDELPGPQRDALEVALLRRRPTDRAPDMRTVGSATLSLLARACAEGGVLVAVDDAQWLDDPSLRALEFALRRWRLPHVVMVTLRDGFDSPLSSAPAQTESSQHVDLRLGPLNTAVLRDLVWDRLGRRPDRATMERIGSFAGGNPLLALELARSSTGSRSDAVHDVESPTSSAVIRGMQERVRSLSSMARDALLSTSALAAPTAEVLERAGVEHPAEALAQAEGEGIVIWSGDRVEFAHPMWREVIYRQAEPEARRAAHARLSLAVSDPEERARHLALGTVQLKPATTAALVSGAARARSRGAPSAAAGLLGMAIDRGSRSPTLRLQAAVDHFAAGDVEAARQLATALAEELPPGRQQASALCLLGEIGLHVEDFVNAVAFLKQAFEESSGHPSVRADICVDLAFALSNLGESGEGLAWARRAEECSSVVGDASLAAEAAAATAVLLFLTGDGVDDERIDRALRDEDPERGSPPHRWPSTCAAVVFLGSHRLDRARASLEATRRRCLDRGLESGLWLVLARQLELGLLAGDVDAARSAVFELEEWAALSLDDGLSATALASRVVLAAWCGDLPTARTAHERLLELDGWSHPIHNFIAMSALGMAENAEGRTEAATALLETVGEIALGLRMGEPMASPFCADAIEVLVASGRTERAQELVELYEGWAVRSGTRWPRGVGHRGRALLASAAGELDAAEASLDRALAAFDDEALRYERARTLLLLGGLRRRRRQRGLARDCFSSAEGIFGRIGAAGWAARAQREQDRLGLQHGHDDELTPSELRLAELAASGLTNAAVAARLDISPKTVEAHLTRAYRKLGIRSRAELGQWMVSRAHPR